MKKARLCLILLCTALLLAACGTAPKPTPASEEVTEPRTDAPTAPAETAGIEEPVAAQKLILSLPATDQFEIENKTQKIEVSSNGEKDGVPMNALRVLSPEGEELWKATYAADGTVQCGIVALHGEDDDPLQRGFIYWSVKMVPGESITASYMIYAQSETGKYERLSSILSEQGIPGSQLGGLGGGKKIDISTASAYHAEKDGFLVFLHSMSSKLMEGSVCFDTDGKQMQWGEWFTHEIVFTDPSTGGPTTLEIVGRDR